MSFPLALSTTDVLIELPYMPITLGIDIVDPTEKKEIIMYNCSI